MTPGPIIIVDADQRSTEFYAEVLGAIGVENELRFFDNGPDALNYLKATDENPFIILAEIDLQEMDGLEMKTIIQQDEFLKNKAIPFVFITRDLSAGSVSKAQRLNVQGYFEKPKDLVYVERLMLRIFEYWELSKHMNNI